jgi:hypothetical protein
VTRYLNLGEYLWLAEQVTGVDGWAVDPGQVEAFDRFAGPGRKDGVELDESGGHVGSVRCLLDVARKPTVECRFRPEVREWGEVGGGWGRVCFG